MRYIAKPNTWFDAWTEAKLIVETTICEQGWSYGQRAGLFCGIRNGEKDEEVCRFDEFYELHRINPKDWKWIKGFAG